jgi:hypothetical protein
MSVIPATLEVEIGGLWLKVSTSEDRLKICLKNKLKTEGLGAWLKW